MHLKTEGLKMENDLEKQLADTKKQLMTLGAIISAALRQDDVVSSGAAILCLSNKLENHGFDFVLEDYRQLRVNSCKNPEAWLIGEIDCINEIYCITDDDEE